MVWDCRSALSNLLRVVKAERVSHDVHDRLVTLDEPLVLLPLFEVRFEAEEGLPLLRRAQQDAQRGYDVVERLHLAVSQFRSLGRSGEDGNYHLGCVDTR